MKAGDYAIGEELYTALLKEKELLPFGARVTTQPITPALTTARGSRHAPAAPYSKRVIDASSVARSNVVIVVGESARVTESTDVFASSSVPPPRLHATTRIAITTVRTAGSYQYTSATIGRFS